jgi:hypothetical protein
MQRISHKEPLPERHAGHDMIQHINLIKIDVPITTKRIGQPELVGDIDHGVFFSHARVICRA